MQNIKRQNNFSRNVKEYHFVEHMGQTMALPLIHNFAICSAKIQRSEIFALFCEGHPSL